MGQEHWLIVANGAPLSPELLQIYARDKRVLACDGGYHWASAAALKVDVLLGDQDSIDAECLAELVVCHEVNCIAALDQCATDLEKAMVYLDKQKCLSITVACALGGRADQSLYNLRLLKRFYHADRKIVFVNHSESVRFYAHQECCFSGRVGSRVSVMGFDRAQVCSQGLKYDMHKALLGSDGMDSVSNEIAQLRARVIIQGEALVFTEVGVP